MTRSYKKGRSITAFARVRTRPPRPDEPRPITAPLNRSALTPPTTRAGDTLAAMLKLLKRDKVLAYKQMFLMYPMHKDEEVTLINPDYVVE
mgnify:FL=1